jgi:methylated-DNA-[protein]-cysteine S-methyltransferase
MTDKYYTIFKTKWGYTGLLGTKTAISRLCLPLLTKTAVKQILLEHNPTAINTPNYQANLQNRITAYFEGLYEDFQDVEVDLSKMTQFRQIILKTCQKIPYGQTVSYEKLAKAAKKPKAIRAAASTMAINPIPLIIPCHRVIKKTGKPGQFSAPGGTTLKQKLINHEKT